MQIEAPCSRGRPPCSQCTPGDWQQSERRDRPHRAAPHPHPQPGPSHGHSPFYLFCSKLRVAGCQEGPCQLGTNSKARPQEAVAGFRHGQQEFTPALPAL